MFKILLNHIKATYPDISEGDFNMVMRCATVKEYQKKQILWKEGDYTNEVDFVLKGCFRYYNTNQQGQEHNTQFAIEDWWIGDFVSLLQDKPTQQSIQALEDARVLCFEKAEFKDLLENCAGFRKFTYKKRDRAYEAAVKRLALTNETAEVRYDNLLANYPDALNRFPLYHIASYLGITPESLSRLRKNRKCD